MKNMTASKNYLSFGSANWWDGSYENIIYFIQKPIFLRASQSVITHICIPTYEWAAKVPAN